MLIFIAPALLFGFLAWQTLKNTKEESKIFGKMAAYCFAALAFYFTYMAATYIDVGNSMRTFYNGGVGSTYRYTANNSTYVRTFYDQYDARVGEYFALQKTNADVISIVSGILPYLAILISGWAALNLVETGFKSRERVT